MRTARLALLSAVLTAGAGAHPHVEPPVSESKPERDALLNSKSLTASEGLPHPAKEAALFAAETKRRDVRSIADFRFYKPELKPDPGKDQRLRKLLAEPSHFAKWSHRRRGGFVPDWCLTWRAGKDEIHALVSFGCQEVIFVSPEQQLRYDLTAAAFKTLQAELAPLRAKRPAR